MNTALSPSDLALALEDEANHTSFGRPRMASVMRAAALALREREAECEMLREHTSCCLDERDENLARIRQLEEALRKLLARFIACARAHGNSAETINDATAEARDALAPSPQEPK
jgi:hypothetical protein